MDAAQLGRQHDPEDVRSECVAAWYNPGIDGIADAFREVTKMSSSPWSTEIDKFLAMLLASHLISISELDRAYSEFRRDVSNAVDIASFSEFLIARQQFTKWQLEKIGVGKFLGFQLDDYVLLEKLPDSPHCAKFLAENRRTKQRVNLCVQPFNYEVGRVEYSVAEESPQT